MVNKRIKYYPNVIGFISVRLKKKFPKAKPNESQENMPAYLLWMMKEMQKFDDSVKAGRWIGWIMAHAEVLGIMTNKQSRRLARMDCKRGFI
ncbi:MAG: hypothetical protein PHN74_01205 [Candidatus Pacebacteria bacterium]|nr:hypothetical protein [Candidatus Paceibacterota bacterium]